MSQNPPTARLHIIAAKAAPIAVVIRRKPTKQWHIMVWNTETGAIEHGSWFQGSLYPNRMDLSPDGRWLVYLAMGRGADTWNAVCRAPYLRALVCWSNSGTWYGGGLWQSQKRLELNGYPGYPASAWPTDAEWLADDGEAESLKAIVKVAPLDQPGYGEDEGVLYARFERDGFQIDSRFCSSVPLPTGARDRIDPSKRPIWTRKASSLHPTLEIRFEGYFDKRGRKFAFSLVEYPGLLVETTSWATWDCLGQLLVARDGCIERWQLGDFAKGAPGLRVDLEDLQPPAVDSSKRSGEGGGARP